MFHDEYEAFKSHTKLPPASISSIPMFGGRPVRDTIISAGEIQDLIISLETDTVEQFYARYGIAA